MTHNPTQGGGGSSTPLTPVSKVLPIVAEVRVFCGTDPDHSAQRGGDARLAASTVADRIAASAVATTQGAQTALSFLFPLNTAVMAEGEPKFTCHYCQREGYTAHKCYKCKKDKQQAGTTARHQNPQ
ncbi:hypothetical protein E2C01_051418 [Portunus trituberculatus]|uniref:Uncharacterized protein n=1 Tax=Portunus trituberculatus TaxID=210409 RepID=A0A5B7GK99_PORTR|nr:hypothetical protein [Portunus trituberculatus]